MLRTMCVILGFMFSACGLLEPRSPELPTNTVQYDPAFDHQTVIVNLKKSIQFKDPAGYIRCMTDSLEGNAQIFVFEPSIEVLSRYSGVFQQWSLNQERAYFQNVLSKIPKDVPTELALFNVMYDGVTPDSVIMQAEYTLSLPHTVSSISKEAAGSLRFVLKRQKNGLWAIQRWTDFVRNNNTIGESWSYVKAQFNN